MKYLLIYTITFLLQGCLYFNDRGISGNLYSECKEYYDAHGNYMKECDENIADYAEIQKGIKETASDIKETASDIKESIKSVVGYKKVNNTYEHKVNTQNNIVDIDILNIKDNTGCQQNGINIDSGCSSR